MGKYKAERFARCFECGSRDIRNLFSDTNDYEIAVDNSTGKEVGKDSDFYQVHYDCLFCNDCKVKDFPDPDLWYESYLTKGYICECGGERHKIIYNDILSNKFEVRCLKCGKEKVLDKEID